MGRTEKSNLTMETQLEMAENRCVKKIKKELGELASTLSEEDRKKPVFLGKKEIRTLDNSYADISLKYLPTENMLCVFKQKTAMVDEVIFEQTGPFSIGRKPLPNEKDGKEIILKRLFGKEYNIYWLRNWRNIAKELQARKK